MSGNRLVLSDFTNEPAAPPQRNAPLLALSILQPYHFHDFVDFLSTPTRTPLVKQYMTQAARLKSYGSLFECKKTAEELSANGFFWLGPWVEPGIRIMDHVRCFWCKTTLLCWEEVDIIAEEHMKIRPDCPFARKMVCRELTQDEREAAITSWKDTQKVKLVRRHGIPCHLIRMALEEIYDNKYPFPDSEGLLAAISRILENSVVASKPEGRVDACKVCLLNQVSILFVPCGHLACCMTCSREFLTCPVCKVNIKERVVARLT